MKKIKLLELHKCCGQYKIIVNNILSYKGVCGVWVMYDNHNRLLEVAQTSNVFEELEYDLLWLMKDYSNELNLKKRYAARRLFDFNKKFNVLACDKNRTTAKYRNIAENSETIVVYLIIEERAINKEKTVREEIELEIAIDNQALYWNAYGSQRKLAKNYYKQKCKLHKEDNMAQNLVSEEQVKEALQISNFREISKDKIMEFVSLIPNMDKEVAIAIINQFPAYADSANNMVAQLNVMCDNVIKDNNSSQKDAVEAYKMILQDLSELLKKEDISKEERDEITEKMILVADKISAKDTENKDFLNGIIKYGAPIVVGALLLGAAILGVNVKGTKLPTIKK